MSNDETAEQIHARMEREHLNYNPLAMRVADAERTMVKARECIDDAIRLARAAVYLDLETPGGVATMRADAEWFRAKWDPQAQRPEGSGGTER